MTEIEAQPMADTPAPRTEPTPEATTAPGSSSRRDLLPWLCGLGFLVLLGLMFYLWQNPVGSPADQLADMNNRLGALDARLGRLEQQARADTSRVDALEKRPVPDLAPIVARLTAVEQKAGADPQLASRVDALSTRVDQLNTREQTAGAELTKRMDSEATRVAALEKTAGQVSGLADKASRLARVQAAQAALDAGQPLGNIPGAPAALSRFAAVAPPTAASLRLAYPAAERAALDASSPDTQNKPFLGRVLARMQDLVTVRQGDRVIVGDEAAGILARARTAITAGDVAGAVSAVSSLQDGPAEAMADWLAQAKALLAAQSALADMAAHA